MHFTKHTKYAKLMYFEPPTEGEPVTAYIKQELTIPCKTSFIAYPDW